MCNIYKRYLFPALCTCLIGACTNGDYFETYDIPVSQEALDAPYPRLIDTPLPPKAIESSVQSGAEIKAEILAMAAIAKSRTENKTQIIDSRFRKRQASAQLRRK